MAARATVALRPTDDRADDAVDVVRAAERAAAPSDVSAPPVERDATVPTADRDVDTEVPVLDAVDRVDTAAVPTGVILFPDTADRDTTDVVPDRAPVVDVPTNGVAVERSVAVRAVVATRAWGIVSPRRATVTPSRTAPLAKPNVTAVHRKNARTFFIPFE